MKTKFLRNKTDLSPEAEIKELENLFRLGNWSQTDTVIHDYHQTLLFINVKSNRISWGKEKTKPELIKKLKEFWETNPDGLIYFF